MTVNTNHAAQPHPIDGYATLWERWIALWNGDLDLAESIVSDKFIRHLPGRRAVLGGRTALVERISELHHGDPGERLLVTAGPFISRGMVAGRWTIAPTGEGPDGNAGQAGTDILRIEFGRVVECWASQDPPGGERLRFRRSAAQPEFRAEAS